MGVLKERSLKTLLTDLKNWFALKAQAVFSVNGNLPVDGNVQVHEVDLANNLISEKTHQVDEEFMLRTSGGHASIESGSAFLLRMLGNRVHNGYVPEVLNAYPILIPRPVPASITAELNESTFEAYVEEAGTYTVTYDESDGWSATPSLYGITITGTPLDGDSITIVWDGENSPEMTVYAPRTAPEGFTVSIDRDTFVAYVLASATITLTYTTEWSADPADYGITITGNVIAGDQIKIEYTKEDRGTIVQANPQALVSTGWNLYDHENGYARVSHYSDTYGFRIGGTYTSIAFSTDPEDENPEAITPVDGMFSVPSDGYVIVTGGNDTDTYIINAWSDWTEGYSGSFETYSETVVDLSTVMETYFQYGLMRVGNIADEINLNTLTAISRIGRMAYTAENIESAKASGRAYEADTNYIYIVKADEDVNSIFVDGGYEADDHGNEFISDTEVPVYVEVLYGNNLKNKLERDVVTISQQTLASAQQAQVRTNIGAASQAYVETYDIGTGKTLAQVESALTALGDSMEDLQTKNIRFSIQAEGIFIGTGYLGTIKRYANGRYCVSVQNIGVHNSADITTGNYYNGTWSWESLKIKITNKLKLVEGVVKIANAVTTTTGQTSKVEFDLSSLINPSKVVYILSASLGANPAGVFMSVAQGYNSGTGIWHAYTLFQNDQTIAANTDVWVKLLAVD